MKAVLPAVAIITVLFSCQKSSDDQPQPEQKDFIGKYTITKLLFQTKGHPDEDLLSTLPGCTQDDLLVFAADSLFKTEDAGVSCGQSENEPTVWFTKGNKMYIDGVVSDIVSFDKHTLVLTTPMEFFGAQGIVKETLEKQ
ncbi:MAG TPA: hypothetical protein VF008_19280 [Niastella sp.]